MDNLMFGGRLGKRDVADKEEPTATQVSSYFDNTLLGLYAAVKLVGWLFGWWNSWLVAWLVWMDRRANGWRGNERKV